MEFLFILFGISIYICGFYYGKWCGRKYTKVIKVMDTEFECTGCQNPCRVTVEDYKKEMGKPLRVLV